MTAVYLGFGPWSSKLATGSAHLKYPFFSFSQLACIRFPNDGHTVAVPYPSPPYGRTSHGFTSLGHVLTPL